MTGPDPAKDVLYLAGFSTGTGACHWSWSRAASFSLKMLGMLFAGREACGHHHLLRNSGRTYLFPRDAPGTDGGVDRPAYSGRAAAITVGDAIGMLILVRSKCASKIGSITTTFPITFRRSIPGAHRRRSRGRGGR